MHWTSKPWPQAGTTETATLQGFLFSNTCKVKRDLSLSGIIRLGSPASHQVALSLWTLGAPARWVPELFPKSSEATSATNLKPGCGLSSLSLGCQLLGGLRLLGSFGFRVGHGLGFRRISHFDFVFMLPDDTLTAFAAALGRGCAMHHILDCNPWRPALFKSAKQI